MPLITNHAFLIPRGTSQLVVAPAYEKPLLQLRYNTGQADRAFHVKQLPEIPAGLPPKAQAQDRDCEAEMTRLSASYGIDRFRKCYPIDDLFIKAFEACTVSALPPAANAGSAVPDMAPAADTIIDEFLSLRVPTLTKEKAKKLVDAGFDTESILNTDVRSIEALTGLSTNLIRSIVEASKRPHAAPATQPVATTEKPATP